MYSVRTNKEWAILIGKNHFLVFQRLVLIVLSLCTFCTCKLKCYAFISFYIYTDTTQLGDGDIPGYTRNDRAVHCWTSLCFVEVNTFYSNTVYVICIMIYLYPLIYPLNTICISQL